MRKLIELLFGCSHRKMTFPLTRPRRGTYVACLHCGREFDYDWKDMRMGKESAA